MRRHKAPYSFTWRKHNECTLLENGDQFFPKILAAIDHANIYVLFETYLITSGALVDDLIAALERACRRGVSVYVLLDDYGARQLSGSDRDRLQKSGAKLLFYNPLRYKKRLANLLRNHRKLILLDGHVGFVGGAGFTDVFDPARKGRGYWRDLMLEIRGPVLHDWQMLFCQTWQDSSGFIQLPEIEIAAVENGWPARVVTGSGVHHQEINRSLVRHARRVQRRVWITSPYFIASWKIRRTLRRSAHKGIDVRLLLPGPYSDHPWVTHAARGRYGRLLREGVRIFEYQPGFSHAKVMLCDDWVSLGSCNLDRWDQFWNLDANQEFRSTALASQVEAYFDRALAESVEVHYPDWKRRPFHSRMKEWFASRLVIWLERLSRYRQIK